MSLTKLFCKTFAGLSVHLTSVTLWKIFLGNPNRAFWLNTFGDLLLLELSIRVIMECPRTKLKTEPHKKEIIYLAYMQNFPTN